MDGRDPTSAWPTIARRVWFINEGQASLQDLEMVQEEPLSLRINGCQAAVLMRLPGMEKELAAGFCLSEGLVDGFLSVLAIRHCGQQPAEGQGPESRNQVDVTVRPEALNADARLEITRLVRAGCGAVDIDRAELSLRPVEAYTAMRPEAIIGMSRQLRAAQQLHQHVGGVHAAGLFSAEGKLVILCEDIGRHNAVDKALGYCLLRDMPLDDKLLLTSGRLSYEMALKAIRMGVPILASVSAPTALAVQLAETYHLTLIGYLRAERLTVYTHPQRILTTAPTA
jgi:FdhD protein